jgi:uncharacterized protein YbcI
MNVTNPTVAEQLALIASRLQTERTGHAPKAVTVVLSEDTLVVTLHDALTPAERALAQNADGAAQVQEFHRQLFANSNAEMRQEIERITGRSVREATAELEPATGAAVYAFTTGAMVQVYLLVPPSGSEARLRDQVEKAEDDGLPVPKVRQAQA